MNDPALAATLPGATLPDEENRAAAKLGIEVVEPENAASGIIRDQVPPSILDRFDDIHFLGRGGMGTVYRGFDKQLAREVAIKFVHGHDAALFLREARAQARITHDNVCKIYDVGFADGQPYITMQLVRGEPLSIACKNMTLEEKIKVIREAASALHEAHRLGLVHRDVKPGNILVERTDDGRWRPFVMDFGLARLIDEPGETITGHVAGTPAYMAPEQARGEIRSLDRRTDVYSLGATFYDILADRPPFVEEQPWKILMRIETEDAPALRSVCPNVPLDLETIVMKCLERDPARRYDSARALGEDLQRYLDGEPVLARKASVLYRLAKRAKKHKVLVGLVATALAAVVAVVVVGFRARRIAAEEARIAQELGEDVKEMQLFMRYAHSLPTHDIERERAVVRKRLADIEAKMTAGGAIGRGAGHYALGRGHLALQEPEEALEELKAAQAAGYASPELEYALGRVLVEIYRDKLEAARRIADKKKMAERQAEIDAALKTPALKHLRAAAGSRLEHPAYIAGLIALTEERYDDALRLARQAQDEAPWFYEAMVLEAETHYVVGAMFKHDADFDYDKMSGHFGPALDAYRRAAGIASSDSTVHEGACKVLLQWIYADGSTNRGEAARAHFDDAKEVCKRAVDASPTRPLAHLYYAWGFSAYYTAYPKAADVESGLLRTIELAESALQTQPDSALANWLVGISWRGRATHLAARGLDANDAFDRALASYERARKLDNFLLWPINEAICIHLQRYSIAMFQHADATLHLDHAAEAVHHAQAIAPDAPFTRLSEFQVAWSQASVDFMRGMDPGTRLDSAQRLCDDMLEQQPNNPTYNNACALVPSLRADLAIARGDDPIPFIRQQERLLATGQATKEHHYCCAAAALVKMARVSVARGESPVVYATRAVELYKQGGAMGSPDIGPAIIPLLQWHVAKKTATHETFDEPLALLAPHVGDDQIRVEPFHSAAAIHERRATWLLEQRRDPTETIQLGFDFVDKAFKRGPLYPPIFATRGDLYLVKAKATKKPEERQKCAQLAKESFDEALRLNKYLARETEAARKEVDQILAGKP